ncbi:MAG TPA: hypothetical protein VED41_10505 [Solirubrobacteraceae bacterium]|nr:hypothetical protein [Solirubrobacteraceae bacterium]
MVPKQVGCSPEQLAILRWTAGLGAVTADACAQYLDITLASARSRLSAAARAGLLSRRRVLAGEPPLYAITGAGLRVAGVRGLEPCRVSAANAPHALACAAVAAALARAYPDHRVMGERELRREEREAGEPLASARLSASALHRPDLVLWPHGPHERLPVAVEVELSVKAPARLLEICRAWARCRCVAGTLYVAGEEVRRPLARAIDRAGAGERVVLVGFAALPRTERSARDAFASTVPGDA